MRLTPQPFRDFLPYTSLSALKVIHVRKVLERALEIVRHYGSDDARSRAAEALTVSLETAGLDVQIARAPVAGLDVRALSPETRATIGSRVLGLYFHQLHQRGPWFLDLRPRHFSWDEARRTLSFFPSGLWFQPHPEFLTRVQSLYEGFYRQDPSALARGIELYNWESLPLPGFAQRIERLLREHFGPGDTPEARFSIAHFRSTFDRIFHEAADSQAKFHPELTFLGVGLIGLYLTLESLQVPLNPRQAYEAAALRLGPEAA